MALAKTMSTKFGVDTTYHKIATITISWHSRDCYVDVYSYVSQDVREQEKSPIFTRSYDFSGDNFTFNVELNISEQIYNKLKTLEEWENATDC